MRSIFTRVLALFLMFLSHAALAVSEQRGPTENVGGFLPGTMVHTFNGPTIIQSIRVNDRLLSFSQKTGKIVHGIVTKVHRFRADETAKLVIAGEVFYLNPDHRFYTPSGAWIAARDLAVGAVLLNKQGEHLKLESKKLTWGREWLYDLTVEETENYFVGKNEILVHNFAFVIPVATWVIGEGIAWVTAATAAAIAAAAVVATEMSKQSDNKQDGVIDGGRYSTQGGRYDPPGCGRYDQCDSREQGTKIDLDRFSDRQSKSGQRGVLRDPKTGEYLERDRGNNPHGGSHWKLKDRKGKRIATISKDGTILRE